jgi:hypothetical protein
MLEKSLHRSALEIEINQLVAFCHTASSSHLHAGEILAQICLRNRNQSTSCPFATLHHHLIYMLEKSLHRSALEINPLVALRHPASSSHLHAGEILAQVCLRN